MKRKFIMELTAGDNRCHVRVSDYTRGVRKVLDVDLHSRPAGDAIDMAKASILTLISEPLESNERPDQPATPGSAAGIAGTGEDADAS